MASAPTWTIKGVSDRTREVVLGAALAAGLRVGDWVDQALARAAEEARHPKPPAATREDVAELIDARLKSLEAAVAQLAGHPASHEGEAGREARPEPAGEMANAQGLISRWPWLCYDRQMPPMPPDVKASLYAYYLGRSVTHAACARQPETSARVLSRRPAASRLERSRAVARCG